MNNFTVKRMSKQKKLKVTLVRSISGRLPRHRATVCGLGLRRIHQSVIVDDTSSIRGMLSSVSYLLNVDELVH